MWSASIQGTFEAINEAIKQQAEARQQAPGVPERS
jgi:hypothetical protein